MIQSVTTTPQCTTLPRTAQAVVQILGNCTKLRSGPVFATTGMRRVPMIIFAPPLVVTTLAAPRTMRHATTRCHQHRWRRQHLTQRRFRRTAMATKNRTIRPSSESLLGLVRWHCLPLAAYCTWRAEKGSASPYSCPWTVRSLTLCSPTTMPPRRGSQKSRESDNNVMEKNRGPDLNERPPDMGSSNTCTIIESLCAPRPWR
mmetsp:Transcript_15477/g.40057  ORF Transcript_15477/g.40057 Transcript_15477/m.40057 type:complete len:202 (+) Transcript_15477:435-1040(+)